MGEIIQNAVIDYATITIERGLILTSSIGLDYGDSSHQGYGGLVLGGMPKSKAGEHWDQKNFCAEWIVGVMRAADVEDWSKLTGRTVRVKRSGPGLVGMITAIGHIVKDDRWFDATAAFDQLAASAATGGGHD
ncbi:hypothetical protein ACO2RV_16935 [Ancylobacter sp. VNQ12]|uniref:hypothetical protein n=1 Tax=Ancylobacter sp. VNQ12 TaxID=3400920 RepID=UPI003BFF5522